MSLHPLAGKPASNDLLVNIPRLVSAYYTVHPDPANIDQKVSFGTSGHRGTSETGAFNEAHIVAISAAICDYRELPSFRPDGWPPIRPNTGLLAGTTYGGQITGPTGSTGATGAAGSSGAGFSSRCGAYGGTKT